METDKIRIITGVPGDDVIEEKHDSKAEKAFATRNDHELGRVRKLA